MPLLNQTLPATVQAGAPAQLQHQRSDIQQAELELVAAKADVAAARAAFYPTVTLTPYIGTNAFKLQLLANGGSITYRILGSLTAPVLYHGVLKRRRCHPHGGVLCVPANYSKWGTRSGEQHKQC